jgi:hypothetical protein
MPRLVDAGRCEAACKLRFDIGNGQDFHGDIRPRPEKIGPPMILPMGIVSVVVTLSFTLFVTPFEILSEAN